MVNKNPDCLSCKISLNRIYSRDYKGRYNRLGLFYCPTCLAVYESEIKKVETKKLGEENR